MRILFYYRNRESLGIEYLSAVLKQAGHRVDLLFSPGLDDIFYFRNKFLNIFNNEDRLLEKAEKFSPDLVAFSSTTNEYPYVTHMANRLKQRLNVPVIVGGIHPTAVPDLVLSNPNVDMICRGEGELAILELVNKMEKGMDFYNTRNIWFKKENGMIIRNELRPLIDDLDSLPFPDKDLFHKYGCFNDLIAAISARGCLFNCTYCHNNLLRKLYAGKGKYIRRRSVRNLIDELKIYKEKYKNNKIIFEDDLFVKDRDWLEEFSYYYAREIKMPFYCNAFPLLIDEETVRILKRAGCKILFMGIDCGSKSIREKVLKRNTPEELIKKNIDIIKKHKILLELSIVFGWPEETPEDMWRSVKLIDNLKPSHVDGHILYLYPKTDILEYCQNRGLVDDDTLSQIYEGKGGIVCESLLKHPYKDLAYVISKLLPLYVKTPVFLKPIVKKLMHPRMKKLANIIFVAMIPIAYPTRSLIRLKEFFLMALTSIRKSTYATVGRSHT